MVLPQGRKQCQWLLWITPWLLLTMGKSLRRTVRSGLGQLSALDGSIWSGFQVLATLRGCYVVKYHPLTSIGGQMDPGNRTHP